MGKIAGSIEETGNVQQLADPYDKIQSGTQDDPELYAFLLQKSKQYKLANPKGTRDNFIENVDNGIITHCP